MPHPNDAELTELYSASIGLDVEDDEPNTSAPGTAPAAKYDVHVEAVAGNVLGNGGEDYKLTLTCIDDTLAAPNASMSIGPLDQDFSAASGWKAGGAAGNFWNEQTFKVTVPKGVRGHVFHYIGTLVGKGNNVVSFIESNRFILL